MSLLSDVREDSWSPPFACRQSLVNVPFRRYFTDDGAAGLPPGLVVVGLGRKMRNAAISRMMTTATHQKVREPDLWDVFWVLSFKGSMDL
jgi:hypothetical protein